MFAGCLGVVYVGVLDGLVRGFKCVRLMRRCGGLVFC